jgi:type II secretory ATPase GspE/PulE/Tfp pilus assembly ATPase PilB-like protein
MATQVQLDPTNAASAGTEADLMARLGAPGALARRLVQVLARPTGLIVVTGPGVAHTGHVLCDVGGAQDCGVIGDRASTSSIVEASEHGLVVALAEEADVISTIVALRRRAADRFAFAASLRMVIAQREVARLCADCRAPEQAFGSMSALLGFDPGTILWSCGGCDACDGTGRSGSVTVYEGVEIDSAMRRLIYDGADAPLLARHAFLTSPNFASAARRLAREGVIAPHDAVEVSRA